MSMRNYANSGYVVPAISLAPLLSTEALREQWTEMVNESGTIGRCDDELREWLAENLPAGSPLPFIFTLDDECESEDLEIGTVYAQFDEADLFETKPSPYMEWLQERSVNPAMSQWVTFG